MQHRCSAPSIIIAMVALMLIIVSVDAKGSFGYSRSSGGGYYRTTKRGYYSSRTRYYTAGMYWSPMYTTRYSGRTSRTLTTDATRSTNDLQDVLCKREIRLDNRTAIGSTARFNATMNCIKELYAIPGDAGNLPYEQLMLNRLQWEMKLRPYPTVQLTVFPDRDIPTPSMFLGLRVPRIFIADTTGAEVASFDLDDNSLTWNPCTIAACTTTNTDTFSRPSSRFLDGGRITQIGARTTLPNGARVTLDFWLSGDFNEDTERDHVLLMPSLVKVDVSLEMNSATFCAGSPNCATLFPGVEVLLVVPNSGPGSALATIPADLTTTYSPRAMNRIEIGSTTDKTDGKAGLFTWWGSAAPDVLCRALNAESSSASDGCVHMLDNVSSSSPGTAVCGLPTTDPRCFELYQNQTNQRVMRQRFLLKRGFSNTSSIQQWSTYFHAGFWDPNEGVMRDAASSVFVAGALALALALSVLAIA